MSIGLSIGLSLRGQYLSGGFDPATLFASGEEGVWLEPSTSTAFLSATDLTPCAVGDECGFLLDKSQGAGYSGGSFTGLGSELVTNGTFATASDWLGIAGGSDLTIAEGQASVTISSSFLGFYQEKSIPNGVYLASFDLVSVSGGVVSFLGKNLNDGFSGGTTFSVTATSPGRHEIVFTSNNTTSSIALRNSLAGSTTVVKNLSIRELPGNHATQATFAARPILRAGPHLEDDLVDDSINWTAPADTDYTVARVNSSGTVTIQTTQSLSGATDVMLEETIAGYVAVDRALTSEETTGLTAYLEGLVA